MKVNVFREEDIRLCGNEENSVREILITDIIKGMEENAKYKNSKILRIALTNSIK